MEQISKRNLIVLAALFLWASFLPVNGQTERPRLTSPQPDKVEDGKNRLTEEELTAISKAESPNGRMKTYVRLSEQRLKRAREYVNQEDYAATSEQIKGYTALIADAGRVSKESIPRRDKAHKTLEVALREQIRLLEGIQRDLSASYYEVVEMALKTVQQVRRQALNLLLGADILSETGKPE
jgi:hypothetical protein